MSSQNVDERVVQMEFDNRQFEAGAKETMSTLEKLKQSLKLDESAKGFSQIDKAAKSMDLSSIGANLEALNDRFSTFGIVGMTVIQRLTNAAIDLGNKLANMVSKPLNQIKTGGWNRALNIENAMFKMSGLLKDFEEQREKIDENINYAVSGTAYSYDAAASAMAQLTASGVEFRGEAMDMKNALRGISGIAAMTNSSYEEIAHIFTTVAGNGRLMTDQLNQIAGRGVNAAATLAEQLHISEGELREMVSKGKIDFQTFADAMDQAFGEHAKKANETWTGALSNIKAALSRTGQGFGASLQHWGRDILNAIRPNINNFNKKYLQPFVDMFDVSLEYIATKVKSIFGDGNEGILYLGWVPRVFRTLENVALGLVGIFEQIKKAFLEVFPEKTRYDVLMFWVRIERATNKFRTAFSSATSFVDLFRQKIDEITKPAQDAADTVGKIAHTAEELEEITRRVIRGDFGNGQKRFDALEELGWNWKEVQNHVNETLGCSFRYEIEQEQIAKTAEEIKRSKWAEYKATGKIEVLGRDDVRRALLRKDITKQQAEYLYKEIDAIELRNNRLDNVKDTFKGIASALKIVGLAVDAIKKVIIGPFMEKTLPRLLDIFLSYTAKIGRKVTALADKLEETKWFESFFEDVVTITKDIFTFLGFIIGKLKEFVGWFLQLQPVQDILNTIKNFFSDLSGNVDKSKNKVKEFGKTISNLPGVQKLATALAGIAIAIKNIFESKLGQFSEWFKGLNLTGEAAMLPGGFLWVIDKAAGFLGTLVEGLSAGAVALGSFIGEFSKTAYDSVTNFFQGALDALKPENIKKKLEENGGIKGIILGFFGSIGEEIKKAIDNIKWPDIGISFWEGIGLAFLVLFGFLVSTLARVMVNMTNLTSAAASVMWNINKGIIAFTANLKADVILKIAEAVGVFTLCLVALAFVPADNLITASAAIIVITFALKKMIDALTGFGMNADMRAIKKAADIIKVGLGKLAELAGIALLVVSVAAALYVAIKAFTTVLELVSGPNADKMLKAAKGLGLIFAGLLASVVIILAVVKKLSKGESELKGINLMGFAAVFVGLGAALYLIAAAAQRMQSVNWNGVVDAGIALAVLVGAVALLANVVKDGGKVLGAAALILAISLAVNALIIPLSIISSMAKEASNLKGLIIATVIIAAFMGGVALIAYEISKIQASTLLAMAGVVATIVVAMYAIVNLIDMVNSMQISGKTLAIMAGIVGVLTIATAVMAVVGKMMGRNGAITLAAVAVAFMSLGVACLSFAAAIYVLGAALPVLANGLADFGAILLARLPEITAGVVAIAVAILAGIVIAKPIMAKAASGGIQAFIAGLATSWPEILDFIGSKGMITIVFLVAVLIDTCEKVVPMLIDGLIRFFNTVADGLENRKTEIAGAFIRVFAAIFNIIVESLWGMVGYLGEHFLNWIQSVGEFFNQDWSEGIDKARGWGEGYFDALDKDLDTEYQKIIGRTEVNNQGLAASMAAGAKQASQEYNENLNISDATGKQFYMAGMEADEGGAKVIESTEKTVEGANSAASGLNMSGILNLDLGKFAEILASFGLTLPGNITNMTDGMNFAMKNGIGLSDIMGSELYQTEIAAGEGTDNVLSTITGAFQNSGVPEAADAVATETNANLSKIGEDDNFETGYGRVEDVANGMNEALPLVQEAATNVTSTLLETAETAVKEMGTQGSQAGSAYSKGIKSKSTPTYYSAYALKTSAQNGVAGSYKAGYTPGSQFGEGFYNGISSWADAIANRAYKIVKDAVDSAKEAEKSNSPSKETMKLGNYFGEGFVIGITQMSGAVEQTASDMATSALDTMREAISMAAQVLEDEGDYEPTIRPVIDLSGVHEGAAQINSTLASFKPSTAVKATSAISGTLADRFGAETLQNGVGNVTNNFTQNNYSPRYLSRLDIYRQTKNMFALAKG